MILSGILHYSLGGFTVIRGVAPLGDLARCSAFNPNYQRNLIETHKEEIERFLDDKQYLFFPEVILSALLHFDFNAYKGKDRDGSLAGVFSGKGFVSNINGLRIKTIVTKIPKGFELLGTSSAPQLAYLELPEKELEKGLRLFRIDGNHRLSAADSAQQGDVRYGLPTPFCIVLHEDKDLVQRFEKVVFHNINAKQIPLTSEENLRLILDSGKEKLFDDVILLESPSFGPAYYLARKFLVDMDRRYLNALAKPLEDSRSLALTVVQFLMDRQIVTQTKDADALERQVPCLRSALQKLNTIYENTPMLQANPCHGVLTAFFYFALHNEGKQLAAFSRWVTGNRIDCLTPTATARGLYHYRLTRTQAVDAASLVRVFESILVARKREIFISMPFRDETKETYETIKKTVQQINEKHCLNIQLRPIRIDDFKKGHSYTIDDEILKVIEGSGLLIADLTFGNRNVYHEIGYLMGLNRGNGREQDNFILIADKQVRGEELEGDIGFNLKSWQQLRFASTRQLEIELTQSLETYYALSSE
jgi:hypothetical protein